MTESPVTPQPRFTIIDALLLMPGVGVVDASAKELHRVEPEGLPLTRWGEVGGEWAAAVCGAQVKLLTVRWRDIRTRGTGFKRCKDCREWRLCRD